MEHEDAPSLNSTMQVSALVKQRLGLLNPGIEHLRCAFHAHHDAARLGRGRRRRVRGVPLLPSAHCGAVVVVARAGSQRLPSGCGRRRTAELPSARPPPGCAACDRSGTGPGVRPALRLRFALGSPSCTGPPLAVGSGCSPVDVGHDLPRPRPCAVGYGPGLGSAGESAWSFGWAVGCPSSGRVRAGGI